MYSIANTPFKRDIVKELTDACHKVGMKVGLYYSTRDWYHPDYLVGDSHYAAKNEVHGVVALEDGVIVDAFTPIRKDFL